MELTAKQQAAQVLLRRMNVRRSMQSWSEECGYKPALHHRFLIDALEKVVRKAYKRLAIFLPPGSAKSTYASVLFPPWFLAQCPQTSILTASHSGDLAESFGRRARNLIEQHSVSLGYALSEHSKAAGRWETTNGGLFFCSGVGAGIAGHRADLGLIDDPIGKKEDADSKLIRDKQWDWYNFDFKPRLKPNASVVLIQTRWHEDDLAGRILAAEGEDWKVVRIPFFAEDDDPLGRKPGEMLWPEWFKPEMYPKDNRVATALYQNRPCPEEGDYFKADWLCEYSADMLPPKQELRFYVGSDHAVSLKQEADKTCMVVVGVDKDDRLWVMPELFWKRADSGEVVDEMIAIGKQYRPVYWWAESGHISKAIGPFLNKRMREERCFLPLEEVVSSRDKPTRAQSIRGRCRNKMVMFPGYARWWHEAKHEMLSFPVGTHDDFVDALGEVGQGIDRITAFNPMPKVPTLEEVLNVSKTFGWLKQTATRKRRDELVQKLDY